MTIVTFIHGPLDGRTVAMHDEMAAQPSLHFPRAPRLAAVYDAAADQVIKPRVYEYQVESRAENEACFVWVPLDDYEEDVNGTT